MTAKEYFMQLSILERMIQNKLDEIFKLRSSVIMPSNCNDGDRVQTSISSESITEIYSENMIKLAEMKDVIIDIVDDYIRIYNEENSVFINKEGKTISNKEVYKDNDLFAVNKNGKWGFEDKSGNIKVECIYDRVSEFNQYGYAGIKQDGKWGVIDNTGKVILEPKYEFKDKTFPDFLGKYYKVTFALGDSIYTNN